MPKVSVIIPCFNQLEFLEEAVESVKRQTFTDYEIIIINDGSTEPNAILLLNQFISHNITVIHDTNKGVSAARNKAIRSAQGEYILPLDADDKIHPNYLKSAMEIIEKSTQIEIVLTGVTYFGGLNHTEFLPKYSRRLHLLQNLFFNTCLFRKSSFLSVGGYDEEFMIGWEDWDFYLRLIKSENQIEIIPEFYYYYRIKPFSRNSDLVDVKKNIVEQQLFRKYLDGYLEYFPDPLSKLRNLDYLIKEKEGFEKAKMSIYHSASYRLGNILLYPFKLIRRLLFK